MSLALDSGRLLEERLRATGAVVLDGGLATELEGHGHDLRDSLWSARLLLTDPKAIRRVHLAYLEAGADCVTAASYQASLPGFEAAGLTRAEAARALLSAVELAESACEELAERFPSKRALVAASVGPYGACLADGSEYVGRYRAGSDELRAFHEPRWALLAGHSSLLACETLPSFEEAEVLLELLGETPHVRAWFSFSCRDGESISDGTPIADCARRCCDNDQVLAVGVNCTPPRNLPSLIAHLGEAAPDKPIVVYPNSGEVYSAEAGEWTGEAERIDFGAAARGWLEGGARLIGGCCRTTPEDVAAIRRALERSG